MERRIPSRPADPAIITEEDRDYIQTVLDSGNRLYRAYDRIVDGGYVSGNQKFWFQQAANINRAANGEQIDPTNNQSATFIISYSQYGLATDGIEVDLRQTSNTIASQVLGDILGNPDGRVPSLDEMVRNDIFSALEEGQQTLAGWGGAFYYWDTSVNVDNDGQPTQSNTGNTLTVGEIILSDPAELEKFISSAVVGTLGSWAQNGIDGGTSLQEFWQQMSAGASAAAPGWLKSEIIIRAADAHLSGDINEEFSPAQKLFRDADGGKWIYNPSADRFVSLNQSSPDAETELYLRGAQAERNEILEAGLSGPIAKVFASIGRADLVPEEHKCFLAGTMIDIWPTDGDGQFHSCLASAPACQKPIERVCVGDWVVSFDIDGKLKPAKVTKVFCNDVKIILDFFGTGVTPGHVFYRADSGQTQKFETLIDILRTDGVIQNSDGIDIRASTGLPVNDARNASIQVVTGDILDDGKVMVRERGQLRLGTRFFTDDGHDLSVLDLVNAHGGDVDLDGLIRVGSKTPFPLLWDLSRTIPKPEDYILTRSGTTLEAIYRASEWEEQRPTLPLPMNLDGGPIQAASASERARLEPNLPLVATSERYARSQRPLLSSSGALAPRLLPKQSTIQ